MVSRWRGVMVSSQPLTLRAPRYSQGKASEKAPAISIAGGRFRNLGLSLSHFMRTRRIWPTVAPAGSHHVRVLNSWRGVRCPSASKIAVASATPKMRPRHSSGEAVSQVEIKPGPVKGVDGLSAAVTGITLRATTTLAAIANFINHPFRFRDTMVSWGHGAAPCPVNPPYLRAGRFPEPKACEGHHPDQEPKVLAVSVVQAVAQQAAKEPGADKAANPYSDGSGVSHDAPFSRARAYCWRNPGLSPMFFKVGFQALKNQGVDGLSGFKGVPA